MSIENVVIDLEKWRSRRNEEPEPTIVELQALMKLPRFWRGRATARKWLARNAPNEMERLAHEQEATAYEKHAERLEREASNG